MTSTFLKIGDHIEADNYLNGINVDSEESVTTGGQWVHQTGVVEDMVGARTIYVRWSDGRGTMISADPARSSYPTKNVVLCEDEVHPAPIFGRLACNGTVSVLYAEDGLPVTQLDASVYPVGSNLSARYEHPAGIVLTVEDATALGIEIET